jgi:hypothetical protein
MLDTIAKTAVVGSLISMFNRARGKREAGDYVSAAALVLAGAVIGAGAALMFAPKTGVELRGDVRRRVRQITSTASDKMNRVRDAAESALEQH